VQDKHIEHPEPQDDRRLEEIFGRDLGTEDRKHHGEERAREEWHRENRPPHHDGH